jgi:hypothetical protein
MTMEAEIRMMWPKNAVHEHLDFYPVKLFLDFLALRTGENKFLLF